MHVWCLGTLAHHRGGSPSTVNSKCRQWSAMCSYFELATIQLGKQLAASHCTKRTGERLPAMHTPGPCLLLSCSRHQCHFSTETMLLLSAELWNRPANDASRAIVLGLAFRFLDLHFGCLRWDRYADNDRIGCQASFIEGLENDVHLHCVTDSPAANCA